MSATPPPAAAAAAPEADLPLQILTLVLENDTTFSAASRALYPICKSLAARVVAETTLLTCSSAQDLQLLLSSERWQPQRHTADLFLRNTSHMNFSISDKVKLAQARAAITVPPQASSAPTRPLAVCVEAPAAPGPEDLTALAAVAHRCPSLLVCDTAGCSLSYEGAAAALAAAAPHWTQLQQLNLQSSYIGPAGAAVVGQFEQLTSLNLCCCCPMNAGLHAMFPPGSRHLAQLRELNLAGNDIRSVGAAALAAAFTGMPQLTSLDLSCNPLGYASVSALAVGMAKHQPHGSQLLRLVLRGVGLGADGVRAVVEGGEHGWPQLRHLDLYYNALGAEGVVSFAAGSQHLKQLTFLNLSDNARSKPWGLQGAQALAAAAQHLPQLQHLELAYNSLGPEGTEVLAAAAGQHLTQLRHLELSRNAVDAKAAISLAAAAQHLTLLTSLGLRHNRLGPQGVAALEAAGPHWRQLCSLDLTGNGIGGTEVQALQAAVPHWGKIKV